MASGLKWEELKEQNIKIQQEEGAQTFMREIVQLRRSVNVTQNSGGTNISQLSLARIQLKNLIQTTTKLACQHREILASPSLPFMCF